MPERNSTNKDDDTPKRKKKEKDEAYGGKYYQLWLKLDGEQSFEKERTVQTDPYDHK